MQVIDAPGILDHPLEDRNVVEMQAVTALAHLPRVILFLVDVSGTAAAPSSKAALFQTLKPLSARKPVVLVLNKTDIMSVEALEAEDRAAIAEMQLAVFAAECNCIVARLYGDA